MNARFVVLENRLNLPGRDRFVIIADRGGFWAFLFPLFWLLWHRVWFAAALVGSVTVGLMVLASQTEWLHVAWIGLIALAFLVAMEGGNWRVDALTRAGFEPVAVLEAQNSAEAELKFAHGQTGTDDAAASVQPPPLPGQPPMRPRRETDLVFGGGEGP